MTIDLPNTWLCRLTRITDNGHTRTTVVEGITHNAPMLGKSFVMYSDPLDPAMDYRMVETSEVMELHVLPDGGIRFQTRNTVYLYEKITSK